MELLGTTLDVTTGEKDGVSKILYSYRRPGVSPVVHDSVIEQS